MTDDDQPTTSNRIEGSVHGPSVQAGIVHGGVHITAPSPPDRSQEIQSLLRAQAQAAQELPRMLPGARRPALADVYVRQDLGSGVDTSRPEPPRPAPILDVHGQLVEVPRPPAVRIAVRPPVRTVREALDHADHLVVTGGAGQGKSTLSLRLAAEAAAHCLGDGEAPLSEPVVPLRLTARALAARLHMPFPDALAASVGADYGARLRKPVSAATLSERVDGKRWLLLVDGLDEVADVDDRDLLAKVLAFCTAESTYRVVLTTRPIEGTVLAPLQRIGAVRYELQPFDEAALRRFALNWFAAEGPELAERFLRQIRVAHLDDLVRVPLLATIAAIVFEQRSGLPLPDNVYELYEEYFAYLRSRPTDDTFERHRVPLLEHLGVVRVLSDTSLVAAARDWIRCHVAPDELPPGWPDRLTEFLVAAGPLVHRGDDMSFLHHSFAEHLAATANARELPETFAADHEAFSRLLHTARPRERGRYARSVALHYTRLHPDQADPLLLSLHAGGAEQHLLAARLLARRMPATAAVVDEFLATVRGWAATTQYLAGDILAHTCRATQHAGLADWLAAIMRDDALPWASRTEAAAALAVRLRGVHRAEAIRFLHALVDDVTATIEVRLAAAEALSDSGASERSTAERGLRSVLSDDKGLVSSYRIAAVLLAAFDGDARDFAVAALLRRLDDRYTAPGFLVEAANGLIEIGSEFHGRAAEAFRVVLHDRVHSETARGNAALGMASLGREFEAEAADALTAVILDRRRTRSQRIIAAESLARLGPQYRSTAGEHMRAMLVEPDIQSADTRYCATRLATLGSPFRDAGEHALRTLLADKGTPVIDVIWSLHALGECGAMPRPELANRLWQLVEELPAESPYYRTVLRQLADLGEPHRTAATDRLRAHLADGAADPKSRMWAASELIDAGPEFHGETTRHLMVIAETTADPAAAFEAWSLLVKLAPQHHDQALRAVLRVIRLADRESGVMFANAHTFVTSPADQDMIADALAAMLANDDRSYQERLSALSGLALLGHRFHDRAARGLCVLFRSVTTVKFDFRYAVGLVANVGVGHREQIANVLLDLIRTPTAGSPRLACVLPALEELGFAHLPEAVAAMRTVIDYSSDRDDRLHALSMLAAVDRAMVPAVTAELLAPHGDVNVPDWQRMVSQLASVGVDVAPTLCALVANPDMFWTVRWASALYLLRSFPDHRGQALAEVERQVSDPHKRPITTAYLLCEFATAELTAWQRAVDGLDELVEDERLEVRSRCISAYRRAQIDLSATQRLFALLERIADDPNRTPAERGDAVDWSRALGGRRSLPTRPWVVLAAAADGDADLRTELVKDLPRWLRTRAERTALDNRSSLVKDRLPLPDTWDDLPLAADVTAALREVMTAPEFLPLERVDAAEALARLDIVAVAEATAVLDGVPDGAATSFRAKTALMQLGTARGREVRRELELIVADETQSLDARAYAAGLLKAVTPRTPAEVIGVLRAVAANPAFSVRVRAEALLDLGPIDGLGPLRALRDDGRTPSSVRWYAANALTGYRPEDNAAAAHVFAAIAEDPHEKAALRWRAAWDLAYRGRIGRDKAAELLRGIAEDARLPVTARAMAADTLGDISPNLRAETVRMLRSMLDAEKPLQRRAVLLRIGQVRPQEAALELLAMANEERHGAVARTWCAEGAVALWWECRDRAAVVAREVANDESVAWHVRRQAACYLARWSAVCREEARALIRELDRTVTPSQA